MNPSRPFILRPVATALLMAAIRSRSRTLLVIAGIASGAQVYFTHSYVAPVTPYTVAVTDHGAPFAAIVQRGHVAGVQFHPEKSGEVGLTILRNFLAMCGGHH